MERTPVQSSNLASVGFDKASQTLEVEFTGGKVFQYAGESAEEHFNGLMGAETKGRYFAQRVRTDDSLIVVRVDETAKEAT